MAGKVYLVGVGPAGLDLITLRGLEILHQADVVIYDYLVDREILEEAKEGAELICCDKLGKNRYSDGFLIHQEKINNLIVKKAREGKRVVRLKNGDPFIFSRGSQEVGDLVKNNIEFEVVPGVTAANAASCFSGVPLTDRRFASSVVFVTGHEAGGKTKSSIDYKSIANCGTIVLYMAVENIAKITKELIEAGKPKEAPVIAVSNAGRIDQKTVKAKLENIAEIIKNEKIAPPAIFIIGEVAKLENDFNWLRENKRILFTGLSKKRFFIKGTYFHLPLIKIEPLNDYREFDNHLKNIRNFDWVVFSSRYGVEIFFKRLVLIGCDLRILKDINIAAIGNSTKSRLLDFGIRADLVPKNESSIGLLEEFKKIDIKNKKIFLPRSDIADKGLAEGLRNMKAEVVSSIAYKNVMPKNLPDLDLRFFDEIKFSSPSGIRNFVKRYGKPPKIIKISCIGKVTEKEAKRWRLI